MNLSEKPKKYMLPNLTKKLQNGFLELIYCLPFICCPGNTLKRFFPSCLLGSSHVPKARISISKKHFRSLKSNQPYLLAILGLIIILQKQAMQIEMQLPDLAWKSL